jgi:hypothetical protein
MRVPWKIVGLAGIAGVAATTGVVIARKRRDHTDYDPDELRDRLHSRVADAAEKDTDTAQTPVDQQAPWRAPAEADTAVHTAPHGDKAAERAEAPAEAETAVDTPSQGDQAAETPSDADTAADTPPHGDQAAEPPSDADTAVHTPPHGDQEAERAKAPSEEATD